MTFFLLFPCITLSLCIFDFSSSLVSCWYCYCAHVDMFLKYFLHVLIDLYVFFVSCALTQHSDIGVLLLWIPLRGWWIIVSSSLVCCLYDYSEDVSMILIYFLYVLLDLCVFWMSVVGIPTTFFEFISYIPWHTLFLMLPPPVAYCLYCYYTHVDMFATYIFIVVVDLYAF